MNNSKYNGDYPMKTRCSLTISVISAWWEKQLGLAAAASPVAKKVALLETFPGLFTFRDEDLPHEVPDPNHGFTMLKALGADTSIGAHGDITFAPMTPEQIWQLTPPDYASNPVVEELRTAIRQTKATYGSAANVSFSGLLYMAMKLRGQDVFLDFYEEPEMTRHLMTVLGETLYQHLKFLKDECGDIWNLLLGSCSNCMISPAIYEEFIRPHEARVSTLSSYIKGHSRAMGIHHCGTRVDPYLETYAKIPDLGIIEANWESDMDLAERMIPGIHFKPMLDPIQLDEMSETTIESMLSGLLERPSVLEIQAFDVTQHFTLNKMRCLLQTVRAYNQAHQLPGFCWFAVY